MMRRELVDVHVSMAAPTLESRIAVLQQNRELMW